jgi:hypothetical protein
MNYKDALVKWFIRNANIRHGHVPDEAFNITPDAAPAANKLWPLVLTGLLSAAGGTGVAGWLLGGAATPPATTTPAPAEVSNGSLYQFLEDHDLHIPE